MDPSGCGKQCQLNNVIIQVRKNETCPIGLCPSAWNGTLDYQHPNSTSKTFYWKDQNECMSKLLTSGQKVSFCKSLNKTISPQEVCPISIYFKTDIFDQNYIGEPLADYNWQIFVLPLGIILGIIIALAYTCICSGVRLARKF